MNKLSVNMKLATPAFVGGADQSKAELRAASLRGLLRFWWRAIQPPMTPTELREKESKLFGSTDTGQSSFLARITEDKSRLLPTGTSVNNGIGYLGYGIAEYKAQQGVQTVRDALDAGGEFTLQFLFKKGYEAGKDELLDALWCLTHLGGIGSRSRRGFGSAMVASVEGADFPDLPRSPEELKNRIEEKFHSLRVGDRELLPDYTALSRHTAVVIWPLRATSWEQALNNVGRELGTFRSSQAEHPNFLADRDLISAYAFGGAAPDRSPERAAFGLPHNYFFKQTRTQVNVAGAEHDRRASPLFIHLHELGGGGFAAVMSLIPVRFLPKGEQVKIGPAGRRPPHNVPPPPDFAPVRDFLSSLDALQVKI